jgi:hypothetical protein
MQPLADSHGWSHLGWMLVSDYAEICALAALVTYVNTVNC